MLILEKARADTQIVAVPGNNIKPETKCTTNKIGALSPYFVLIKMKNNYLTLMSLTSLWRSPGTPACICRYIVSSTTLARNLYASVHRQLYSDIKIFDLQSEPHCHSSNVRLAQTLLCLTLHSKGEIIETVIYGGEYR